MTTLLPGATSTPAAAEVNPNASSVASVARVPDCVVNVEVGIATALTVACQLPGLSLAVMGRGAPSGRSVRTSAGDYAGKSFKWQETSAFPAPFHFCPKGSLTTVLQITSSNSPALNRSGRPLVRWLRASATSLPPAN